MCPIASHSPAPVVRTATLSAWKGSGVHVKREYAPHPPDDAGEWMVRLAGKRLGGTPRPTMRPRGIGRRWKASPDGRTVCVRKEPTRIRFTRRAARRTEAIKPPPRKRGRFSQLCHNAEDPRDEPAKHAPFGRACALPPSRRAESAVHGVSSVEMIPHSPAQNKRGF